MSSTFLRLELAGRDGDVTLINVNAIVRIHPTFPSGSTIVLSDDTSLHVRATLDEIQARLYATNGRTTVLKVEPHTYALKHQVDEAYEAMRADLLP